ncbi:hypothetical protein NHG32_06365 [Aerococcaceae bacterium NML191219]|nr:hypothetical protein [Aerococcaceae bacterium NML191219]
MNGKWVEGKASINGKTLEYWLLVFDEGSAYGIDDGRISKFSIREGKTWTCNYDRGWDVQPTTKATKHLYNQLIAQYN